MREYNYTAHKKGWFKNKVIKGYDCFNLGDFTELLRLNNIPNDLLTKDETRYLFSFMNENYKDFYKTPSHKFTEFDFGYTEKGDVIVSYSTCLNHTKDSELIWLKTISFYKFLNDLVKYSKTDTWIKESEKTELKLILSKVKTVYMGS